jgi:N-acetylneuraminate lyase
MKGDGSVAPKAVAPLVDFILTQGVHGLYASGSTGESVLQSVQERGEILTALAEHAKGKCTLIAHVGAASTGDAVALARLAGDTGFDAVSAVPPYYYKHRFEDIATYYDEIASAAGLPLIIYNIPALTGTDLSTERLLELMQDSRIAGVKYTAQDLFQFSQLRKAAPDKKFYFGTDEMFLGAAAMGADGGIGSTYNLIGDIYIAVEQAVMAGNIDEARACQAAANDFIAILLEVGVIPGLKYCLTRLGVPVGPCRAPFASVSKFASAKLDAWLENSGIEEHGLLSRAVRNKASRL